MSGIITGTQFIQTFPACDEAVQGASRGELRLMSSISWFAANLAFL